MGFFKRLFGLCETKPPTQSDSWQLQDNKIIVSLEKLPELSSFGQAVRLEAEALSTPVLLVKGQEDNFYAFVNKCGHGGRKLDPMPGKEQLCCCSLGKSTYDLDGKVLGGSSKQDVQTLSIQPADNKLEILLPN